MLTLNDILNAKIPSDIYMADKNIMKKQKRDYVKRFHPDVIPKRAIECQTAIKKICDLYEQGIRDLDSDNWHRINEIVLKNKNGKKVIVKFRIMYEFEIGKVYVSDTILTYVINKENKKYYDNAIKSIDFSYDNDEIREQFSRCLPQIKNKFETISGEYVLILEKTKDVYPLRALLNYYNMKIPAKHVAWILSRLYNLSCYLRHNNIVHNGICIDNLFVSPKYHSILILGGWFYTCKNGEKLKGMPREVYNILSNEIKENKVAGYKIDLESIRQVGRILLGDKNGTRLSSDKEIPNEIVNFVRSISKGNSLEDYKSWDEALNKSYGKRVFIPMEVVDEQIYKN